MHWAAGALMSDKVEQLMDRQVGVCAPELAVPAVSQLVNIGAATFFTLPSALLEHVPI